MPHLPTGWELILILLVIVVVFGSKRLPDSARALGRSMRILKAETKGLHDDDAASASQPAVTASQLPTAPVVPPVNGLNVNGLNVNGLPVNGHVAGSVPLRTDRPVQADSAAAAIDRQP